jgi:hypothetical protein
MMLMLQRIVQKHVGGLFNDPFSTETIAFDGRVTDELEIIWKELVVA